MEVPGTRATEMVLPQRATLLTGIGVTTGARILLEVGDRSSSPTSGHLAAYPGLAPITRRSGLSIRGQHRCRAGNNNSSAPSHGRVRLHDPASWAY